MGRKLMVLAGSVFGALGLVVIPATALAGEYQIHCSSPPCTGTISGNWAEHPLVLENDNGEKIGAMVAEGTVTISSSTTTTASAAVELAEVRELISGFKFTCQTAGAESGVVKTGALSAHFVNLEAGGTTPGILLTNINVTMSCANGLVIKTVTGNLIGEISEPNCNKAATQQQVTFGMRGFGAKGTQQFEQVTETGTFFDLISGTHGSDTTTSAQSGRGIIKWDKDVTLTC